MEAPGSGLWRRTYVVAAAAVATVTVLFALEFEFRTGGDGLVTAVDDVGEAVAALLAAAAAGWASRHQAPRFRAGWLWIALAAFSWGAGEVVWAVYEVGLGQAVPFPSVADAGFLLAIPLTIIGIRSFALAERAVVSSWRLWLDGLIVFLSLIFVGWAAGLDQVVSDPTTPVVAKAISVAYPVGDLAIGAALLLSIRGAVRQEQGSMLLLLGGIACNAISDSAFAYLTANNSYTIVGSVLDTGWVAGFLMIALAAMWPAAVERKTVVEPAIDVWQIAMPWLAILAAVVAGLVRVARGIPLDLFLSFDTAAIGGLTMLSQITLHRDSRELLVKARTSEATLANVVTYAPAAIVRLDRDLHILEVNPQFDAIVRAAGAEYVGQPISRFLPAEEAARFTNALEPVLSGERLTVVSDSAAQRADGTAISVHWSATSVPDERGGVDYFIATFDDTTARREQEAASAASLDMLQRLNRLKTEFLQTLSHEFKTALVGILGFSEFMQTSSALDPSEIQAFAADIHKDADRLQRLMDEMLNLDRVETSRATLALAPVNVTELLTALVEDARRGTDGLTIDSHLDPAMPPIKADGAKLSDAFRALLESAIRFSPDGGRIGVIARINEPNLEVIVSDQGAGVRADFDRRLFGNEDIYAESPLRRLIGTGLGLGIIRQIAELHGGRVWINRLEAKGSEFHFEIPAATVRATGVAALRAPVVA